MAVRFPTRVAVAITAVLLLAALNPSVSAAITTTPVGASATVGHTSGFSPGAGINLLPSSQVATHMTQMSSAGATWVRLDINWSQVESTPGVFDWSIPDKTISAARNNGLLVLGLITYAPDWAFTASAPSGTPPVIPAQFGAFAAAAAQRYAVQGVTHWEIWNEPNLASFWGKAPHAGEYAQVLSASAAAIRAVSPNSTILTGGLAPATDTTTTLSPVTFVTDLYNAGARSSFDAVGMHPYSYPERPLFDAPWNQFRTGMHDVHDVMTAWGDGAKTVWPTEYGAPTGTHSRAVTEAAQRDIIVEALACAATHPWIGPLFVYNLADPATGVLWDLEDNFGLRRANGTAKLSWSATQQKMGEPAADQTCPEMTRELCNGKPVTVRLAQGDLATADADVILGTSGPDIIRGLGGNDTICALGGPDRIDGGTGHDWIDGGLGIDRVHGRAGNDIIHGGGGSDRIWAGDGHDIIHAGSGADKVHGGPGNDQLFGMGGQDRMRGEAGNDLLQGSQQSDDLWGGAGNDVLRGARGKDHLFGGLGDDELYGGDNSDTLSGDAGADLHDGQRGSDVCLLDGNPGDTFTSC